MKTLKKASCRVNQKPPAEEINFNPDNDHDLWVLLDQAHFAVTRSRLLELAQYDLTKEQAQVLYVLKNLGWLGNHEPDSLFYLAATTFGIHSR